MAARSRSSFQGAGPTPTVFNFLLSFLCSAYGASRRRAFEPAQEVTQASGRKDKREPVQSATSFQVHGQGEPGGRPEPSAGTKQLGGAGENRETAGGAPACTPKWGDAGGAPGPLPGGSWMDHAEPGFCPPVPTGLSLPFTRGINLGRSRAVRAKPRCPGSETQYA